MRTMILTLLVTACGTPERGPQIEVTEHLTEAALMEAASWADPDPTTVAVLVSMLIASELDSEALPYFADRASSTVGQRCHPWFLAAEGVFMARTASSVPLLERIAWVEQAMDKLDEAVALEPGLPTYLRGQTYAQLPARFEATDQAIADLEWVLDNRDAFPAGLDRGALHGLAVAHDAAGRAGESARLLKASGHDRLDEPLLATPYSVTAEGGFRFGPPKIDEVAAGVWLASGYDFGDIGFVETTAGLIAIDAGTDPRHAAAALADVRAFTTAPLTHLILTHGHWDHTGGAAAFTSEASEVLVQSHFSEEIETIEGVGVPFGWFFGDAEADLSVKPTQTIAEATWLDVGGRRLELIPVSGAETADALLVYIEDADIVFVGDAFMPYMGAPFVHEGDPSALIDTIDTIEARSPQLLIHGHVPLTDAYTAHALPGLRSSLVELTTTVRDAVADGRPQSEVLHVNLLPESLRDAPDAVIPYLLLRDNVIKRMYDLRTGYWGADRAGVEDFTDTDWARAIEAVGGGERATIKAIEALLGAGESTLPLRLAEIGLVSHPESEDLAALRVRSLERLRARNQQLDPFKVIVYSEELQREIPPIGAY